VNPAPELRRAQEIFWALIVAPEGARPGLAALAKDGRSGPEEVDRLFAGDERLPALERLDVYANMYFYRLHDCLVEDYPKTRALLGHDRFHNLVTDYVLACPSRHYSLRQFGARLPAFLDTHPLRRDLPGLADLARLEWARADVFDAADAAPLTRADLARLPAERAGEAVFTLIPACVLVAVEHSVAGLWRELDRPAGGPPAHEPVTPAGPVPRRRGWIRVWRGRGLIHHSSVGDEESDALAMLRRGDPLGRICQQIAAGRSIARATDRVGRLLQTWIDDGLLASFALPPS
jgi:hypothetical protein